MKKLWPALLPLLILLPGLAAFPYPSPEAPYSDLAISHLPNALFLKRALVEWHTIPLWSPSILGGTPFAANPLSGLWYPPGWLALVMPLPLGFNLLVALHLLWGGIGMLRLLQAEGLGDRAALLGALAFEAMPKLFAHYGAGHVTLLYAVPWTPWLLYSVASYRAKVERNLNPKDRFLAFNFYPGVILALIFLADVRWAFFAGAIWLIYSFARRGEKHATNLPHATFVLQLIFQILLAALLAAPLAIPLLEYTRLSTRSQLASGDIFAFSLPAARLLGLIFPDFGGMHEWMLYPGAVIFALALLAVYKKAIRRQAAFWIWTAGLSLLFSLGSQLPLLPILARLPGLDLLRVPSRALFLAGLSLAAAAAYSVDDLLEARASAGWGRGGLLLTALAGFSVALAAGIWMITGKALLNFLWGAGFTLLGVIWISLRPGKRLQANLWFPVLLALCLLDWTAVDRSLFSPRPAAEVLREKEAAAQYLASQPGRFRVYSPSYSLPQQTAARFRLELADGVDPLQLQAYVSFMQGASGVPWTGYSVTLPPFASGEPASDNAAYLPNPALLGILNIRYVLAEYDLPVNGLAFRKLFGETRLYENVHISPRAWIQPEGLDLGEQAHQLELDAWTPNRITLAVEATEQENLLVLSEVAYPGWQAWVDGEQVSMQAASGVLRAVHLEPGEHQVTFTFRPLSVYAGLALCGTGLLFGLWWAWRRK